MMGDLNTALDMIRNFLMNENENVQPQKVWESLERIQSAINDKFNSSKVSIRNDYFHSYLDHLNIFTDFCRNLNCSVSHTNSLPNTQRGPTYNVYDCTIAESCTSDDLADNKTKAQIHFANSRTFVGGYTARSDNDLDFDNTYTIINNLTKNYSDLGHYWDFDFITQHENVDIVRDRGPVVVFGFVLLKQTLSKFHPSCLQYLLPLLMDIQREYRPNYYHNSLHGSMVAHLAVILSREIGVEPLLSSYDHVAFVLAALAHDVGHPGRNNLFLANTANPLSLIYNDISTLENYHSSLLFHILRCHPGFVNQFGAKDWQNMRKRMVELILATDMRCHFNHVKEIKERRLSGNFDLCNQEDMWKALVICIKAADIGHVAVTWECHLQWTELVTEEFYDQGDEEKRLGLPISFLCDRETSDELPSTQINFIKCIAIPLIEELQHLETDNKFISNTVIANVNNNISNWSKKLSSK